MEAVDEKINKIINIACILSYESDPLIANTDGHV